MGRPCDRRRWAGVAVSGGGLMDEKKQGKVNSTDPTQEEDEVFDKIYLAYRRANLPNSLPGQAAQLGSITSDWIRTRDTSFMDGAISFCHQNKLPILPELLEHVYSAMALRINNGSSPKKAFAHAAREKLFEEMAKLIYHGFTLVHAAEIAAYYSHTYSAFPMKASTLQIEYPKNSERFVRFIQLVCENPNITKDQAAKTKRDFEALLNWKIPLTKEMKGTRR
jgi:hypothetical protein